MKRWIYTIAGIFFLITAIAVVFFYSEINKKVNYHKIIEIKRGVPLKASLSTLPISDSFVFKVYLKYRNEGKGIKAGYYELKGQMSMKELIDVLESGKDKVFKLTIPEGYSIAEIAELLEKNGRIDKDKFYKEFNGIEFPYPTPDGNFEGYLYPETYYIPENYNERLIIRTLLREFLKKFPPEKYEDKDEFYQKLIMASILEREAKLDEEKPLMASVFYNRLKKKMTLSSDATVNFLYDYKKRRMYYKDLEIDSPYNTYKYKGLPPGPISNPSVVSVEAAYNPADTDYLFFVATGDGGHFFSKGAMRISAREFELLVKETHLHEIEEFQRKNKENK